MPKIEKKTKVKDLMHVNGKKKKWIIKGKGKGRKEERIMKIKKKKEKCLYCGLYSFFYTPETDSS